MITYIPIQGQFPYWKPLVDPDVYRDQLINGYASITGLMKIIPFGRSEETEPDMTIHRDLAILHMATPITNQQDRKHAHTIVFDTYNTQPLAVFLLHSVSSCRAAQQVMDAYQKFILTLHNLGYYHTSLPFHHILVQPTQEWSLSSFGLRNSKGEYDYYRFVIADMMDASRLGMEIQDTGNHSSQGLASEHHHMIESIPETQGSPKTHHSHFVDQYQQHHRLIMHYDYEGHPLLPSKTVHPCHECRLTFEHAPLGCPIEYKREGISDQGTLLDTFMVEGNFCSLSCIKAYILRRLAETHSSVYKKSLTLLQLMAHDIHGHEYVIPPAIPYTQLQKWGGSMTEDQFRKDMKDATRQWNSFHHTNRQFQRSVGVWTQASN